MTTKASESNSNKKEKRKRGHYNGWSWNVEDNDDGWGGFGNYMAAKQRKLDEQFQKDSKGQNSNIFSGVVIYVNGFTNPSSDELRRLMQEHGGRYELYLKKTRITHVIASNLPNSKFKLANTMPVVKPDWITDSVKSGKRLSHIPYLLLGNQSQLQPGLTKFSYTSPSKTAVRESEQKDANISSPKRNLFHVESESKQSIALTNEGFTKKINDAGGRGAANSNLILNKSRRDQTESVPRVLDANSITGKVEAVNLRPEGLKVEESEDEIISNSEDETEEGSATGRTQIKGLVSFETKGGKIMLHNRSLQSCHLALNNNGSPKLHLDKDKVVIRNSEDYAKNVSTLLSSQLTGEECDTFFDEIMTAPHGGTSPLQTNPFTSKRSINRNNSHSGQEQPYDYRSTKKDGSELSKSSAKSSSSKVGGSVLILGDNGPKRGDNGPTAGDTGPKAGDTGPTVGDTLPKAGDTVLKAGDNGPKAGDTGPTAGDNGPTAGDTGPKAIDNVQKTRENHRSKSGFSVPKAGDRNFLSEFYSNSRLHHISKWGAELKAYVAQLQQSDSVFPGREKLRQAHIDNMLMLGLSETLVTSRHSLSERTVMHIDMDSFFVSVGLLARPDLKGQPVAVTHYRGQSAQPNPESNLEWERAQWRQEKELKGRSTKLVLNDLTESKEQGYGDSGTKDSTVTKSGYSMAEIASCSYEARKAGVKNGMFMGQALRLCPDLKTIPYDFEAYNKISKILYDVVASYTHDIEAVSCDEMFIDATDILTDTGATAMELASVLRAQMMDRTGCPASVGIGPNILLARLATRKAKPCGQYKVEVTDAQRFIQDCPVRDLPGVGYSLASRLSKMDVATCGQLQEVSVQALRREFGPKMGELLHRFSLGQDDRQVRSSKLRKSVSAEVNYGIRFTKEFELVNFLQEMANEVKKRMDAIKVQGRCITLKLMVRRPDAPKETAKYMGHGVCNILNKSTNIPLPTNDVNLIAKEVVSMYRAQHVLVTDIRGIGIQMNKLESDEPLKGRNFNEKQRHQSILSFTTLDTVPASSKPSVPSASVSKPPAHLAVTAMTNTSSTTVQNHNPENSEQSSTADRSNILIPNGKPGLSVPTAAPSRHNHQQQQHKNHLCEPGPSSRKEDDMYLLSESQLDNEVLQELPEEIAQEIVQDIRQRKKASKEVNSRPTKSSETTDFALPSMSQEVDVSCLNALPPSLQLEIKQYYEERRRSATKKQSSSPVKERGKGPNGGTIYKQKGKRGRGKGKKKINYGTRKVKFVEHVQNPTAAFVEHLEGNASFTNIKHSTENSKEHCEMHERDEEVSLCDARHIDDVRKLLKEWWQSNSEPHSEDIQTVSEYFVKLIQYDHLEQAYCLVKTINRKLHKVQSPKWQECLKQLIELVQEVIRANGKAPLKL